MVNWFLGRFSKLRSRKGQGMTEYIIIVAMIAIACIVVVKVFGKQVYEIFAKSKTALGSGQAQTITPQTGEEKGLGDYNE